MSCFTHGLYNIEPELTIKPQEGITTKNPFNIPSFFELNDTYLFEMILQTKINGKWEALVVVDELWKFVNVKD